MYGRHSPGLLLYINDIIQKFVDCVNTITQFSLVCTNGLFMNDKHLYFPGYVIREVFDSSPHYEKFLVTAQNDPSRWFLLEALTKDIALTNEVRQVFEVACHEQARVRIPGIVPVYEIGASEQYGTFVTFPFDETFLSLFDFSGMQKSGGLKVTPNFYASIILDAARILDAAHRQNLAHYTVMPTSIIVRPDGTVNVCHFIEAAMRRRYYLASGFDDKLNAPEWRQNETVGSYSDIYALSAFLYLLLTEQYQPDETEPQWFSMGDILIESDIHDDAVLPLMSFFHATLATSPSRRLSNYPQLIRALADLLTVLGPYVAPQERQSVLQNYFEPFPGDAGQISRDLCKPGIAINDPKLHFVSDTQHPSTLTPITSDNTLFPDEAIVHKAPPRQISISIDDASERNIMEDTLVSSVSQSRTHDSRERIIHHSSSNYRFQSPMAKASVQTVPLAVLSRSRYQVLEELGSGGSGSVYKVLDTTLSEVVALKILKPSLVSDPVWLLRFKNEMRLTRDIDHTYILPAYHLEQLEGVYFFTMKYINGKNLAQILQKGPLPLQKALLLLKQIGQSLQTAHQHGIIHRDFKPANIMIETESFHPWLTDFGIASLSDAPLNAPETLGVGTPYYMSPEQARGDELQTTSDIYSFGVVAYECLTHILPFNGSTPMAVYQAVMEGQFHPIRDIAPLVPHAVSNIIEQCLFSEALIRPQNMKAILDVLGRFA